LLPDAPVPDSRTVLDEAVTDHGGHPPPFTRDNYVRVEVLTPVGVLDRDKKLGMVKEMTEIVAAAAGDPGLAERTWVLISEAPDGWGIDGHPYTNAEIAETARRQITET
jgi:phenylpyruvate tautomerase PptA (4-oxalocrotonate tautomerase family)